MKRLCPLISVGILTRGFAFLAVILSFSLQPSYAAPPIRIAESTISPRIPQPTVTSLFKDRYGFLWIGTQHGLYKFDGATLQPFNSDQTGQNNLPFSDIRGILQDESGKVIVATFGGGIFVQDTTSSTFQKPTTHNAAEPKYLTHMAQSSQGDIWIAGKEGLFTIDSMMETKVPVQFDQLILGNSSEIGAIAAGREGEAFVAVRDSLYRVTVHPNHTEKLFSDESVGRITALHLNQKDSLYIGTDTGHLVEFDFRHKLIKSKITISDTTPVTILSLLIDRDFLWIGTNDGLVLSDESLSFTQTYRHQNSGLVSNHILSVLKDENFVWVGTYSGLHTLSRVPFEIFNEQNSQIFNDVLAFSEDDRKNLWVGTFNGLYLYKKTENRHLNLKNIDESIQLADQRVMTIASRGRELWLGYRKHGVEILDTESMSVSKPTIPMIEDLEVTKILHDEDKKSWIATFNRGVFIVDGLDVTSLLSNGSLPEPSVTILLSTRDGDMIISSERTVYKNRRGTNNFELLDFHFNNTSHAPFIMSISQSPIGDIWIGTRNQGLFIWREEDQRSGIFELLPADVEEGSNLSTVYQVEFDAQGNGWGSTKLGVVKLNKFGNILTRFTSVDGLQGQDFNFGASFVDSLGRIYFGGTNGYNRFSANDIDYRSSTPSLRLTQLSVSRSGHVETYSAIDIDSLQLTHKDYFVKFDFSVLDFLDPEMNQYRYMLKGFDRDWIENGTRNTATYTNLPSGDYVLRVQGANSAGVWNREGISLNIEVLPAPWRTWWAYCLYALLGLMLFWMAKRAYDSFVIDRRAREMALAMHEAEERADDEMQEQLEIHDDLVKSVYRHNVSTLELVGEFIRIQSDYLTDSNALESAAGSIDRIRALTMLEDCLYYQNETLLADLHKFTDILISSLLKNSPVPEETITSINEVSATLLPIEQASPLAVTLYELLENSIQHAFEASSHANYLQITLALTTTPQSGSCHLLTVQDSGIGIPSNIDPLSGHTPGLAVVAAMARQINGTLSFKTEKGTHVSLIFPATDA